MGLTQQEYEALDADKKQAKIQTVKENLSKQVQMK